MKRNETKPSKNIHSPLITGEAVFKCGYAPRYIDLSLDGNALFVGCKDGTVTVVTGLKSHDKGNSFEQYLHSYILSCNPKQQEPEKAGIRTLCEWVPGFMLIGRNDGSIDLINWKHACSRGQGQTVARGITGLEPIYTIEAENWPKPNSTELGSVSHLGWLDETRLMISFNHGFSWVIQDSHLREYPKEPEAPKTEVGEKKLNTYHHKLHMHEEVIRSSFIRSITSSRKNDAVSRLPHSGISSVVPTGGASKDRITRWIFFSSTGRVWLAEDTDGKIEPRPQYVWPDGETPGFVVDFALNKKRHTDSSNIDTTRLANTAVSNGVYVSTDTGVYLLRQKKESDGSYQVSEALRISLPGMKGMCMAMTFYPDAYVDDKSIYYLWVSDTSGDAHLYWDYATNEETHWQKPNWRRSGIRHDEAQVLRAYATWNPNDHSLIVGQAGRNDRCIISRYERKLMPDNRPLAKLRGQLQGEGLIDTGDPVHAPKTLQGWDYVREVADFFEVLRENEKWLRALLEFLGNPNESLALTQLEHAIQDKTEDWDRKVLIEKAIALWSYVLLATVHRCGLEKRESAYSGIIRWLRTLGEPFDENNNHGSYQDLLPYKETVRRSVEKNIMFVRKWGVFGNSYNERFSIQMPLTILERQDDPNKLLDLLVYQSNLYYRCMDPIASAPYKRQAGRTAWDLRYTRIEGQDYLGVSWIWGGVDLFRVVPGQRTSKLDLERCLHFSPRESIPENGVTPIWRLEGSYIGKKETEIPAVPISSHGYSRNILFGTIHTANGGPKVATHFLLTAPAQPFSVSQEKNARQEPLQLWPLAPSRNGAALMLKDTSPVSIEKQGELEFFETRHILYLENESVYSMLQLEPGLILLGLRGESGSPRLKLLRVCNENLSMQFIPLESELLPTLSPDPSIIKRNPIWSLAKAKTMDLKEEQEHVVVAGCANGQVWKIELPPLQKIEEVCAKQPELRWKPTLVGFLGAPVWAVAYRECRKTERVFAGGADGTIVAWQKVHQNSGEGSDSSSAFSKLWATWEREPIARIHTLSYLGEKPENNIPMVLAITHQGIAVFFNDRDQVETTKERTDKTPDAHRQRFIPGERHGRVKLGSTAFATEMVNLSSDEPDKNTPPPRLALASGDGICRILEFDHLPFTPRRKKAYEGLFDTWHKRIQKFPEVDFHLTEATFLSSPALSLILIRCITDRNKLETVGVQAQWLPTHIRPLFALIKAWNDRKPEETKNHLECVLDSARKLDDVRLFKEFVSLILNRCNHGLFQVARSGSYLEVEKETKIYGIILDELEKKGNLWLGASQDEDANVRMIRAKNLLDGDTLWQISQRARTQEKPDNGQNQVADLFRQVLKRRIYQVRQLLTRGDPLLALETLRSCNLSLIRASKRLVEDRIGKKGTDALAVEMPWEGVWEFFYTVSDFASGVAQSEGGLSIALAHEVARVYALGVCCVPTAATMIAHRFAEASLPQELLERIKNQFNIFGEIGITVPKFARELFLLACQKELEQGFTLPYLRSRGLIVTGKSAGAESGADASSMPTDWAATAEKIGHFNTLIIRAFQPYNRIMEWFSELTQKLTDNAREIDLTVVETLRKEMNEHWKEWNQKLEKSQEEPTPPYKDFPFCHTHEFLDGALGEFVEILKNFKIKKIKDDRIRPEIVLISASLGGWCKESRDRLKKLGKKHKMFEPKLSIYDQLLEKLRRAALSFRRSAATQQNIVLGVLDHGLLESLDEHVLELEEVAQALDPFMIWNYRQEVDLKGHKPGSASHFARYLLSRSRAAESIPKNLRVLQGLLDPKNKRPQAIYSDLDSEKDSKLPKPFYKLFEETRRPLSRRWQTECVTQCKGIHYTEEEITYLKLTIKELVQNDRYHGSYDQPEGGPRVYIYPKKDQIRESMEKEEPLTPMWGEILILLGFGFSRDPKVIQRLKRLRNTDLQEPIEPKQEREVPSHGTGLYLANLAAATVGWKLRISKIDEKSSFFWFQLFKMDTAQPSESGGGHN